MGKKNNTSIKLYIQLVYNKNLGSIYTYTYMYIFRKELKSILNKLLLQQKRELGSVT